MHCCLWFFCKERNLATSIDYVSSYLLSPFLLEVGLDCWCESKASSCTVSNSHAPLHRFVQIFLLTPQQLSALNSFKHNRRLDSTLIVFCKAAGLLQRFVEVSSLSAVTNRSYIHKKILGVHTLCHTPQWSFHWTGIAAAVSEWCDPTQKLRPCSSLQCIMMRVPGTWGETGYSIRAAIKKVV